MTARRLSLFLAPQADELAAAVCREADLDPAILEALIGVELKHLGRGRRKGLTADLERIIDQSLPNSARS
jgi:hypothetical protein